jgi:membrane protease YdiL (CAAX protease family)
VTEGEITLAVCAVGAVVAPIAWRLVFARPPAPLREMRSPADRSWPIPVAFSLFLLQFSVLAFTLVKGPDSPVAVRFALGGAMLVIAVAAWFFVPRLFKSTLGVPAAVGAGLLTMCAAMPLVYGAHFLQSLFVSIEVRQDALLRIQQRSAGWQELAFAAMVIAPLIEELTFRVLIYGGLRRVYSGRVAMLISAAAFGLVHFDPPTTVLPMFVFGIILAKLMEHTGSYIACVVAHAAFNIYSVAVALAT